MKQTLSRWFGVLYIGRRKKKEFKMVCYCINPIYELLEKILHRIYKSERFVMSKKNKFHFLNIPIKIGITKNPTARQKQIQQSVFSSGKTEWFLISIPEYLFLLFIVRLLDIRIIIIGTVILYFGIDDWIMNFISSFYS